MINRLLRACALIAAAAWTAGNVVLVGVALTAFVELGMHLGDEAGRRAAGRVFAAILAWWTTWAWIPIGVAAAGLASGAIGLWWRRARLRAVCLVLIALAALGTHALAAHQVAAVNAARTAAAAEGTDLAEDAAFQALHRRAERVFAAETLLGALATLNLLLTVVATPQPAKVREGTDAR